VVHNAYSEQELRKIISEKEAANLHVIPHGDFTGMIEQFKAGCTDLRLKPFDKSKINLLFFGQIKKVKGLDILLHALKNLDDSFHLTIAGKERDDSISSYSGLIDDLKKKGCIEIINRHISDSERDFLLRHCDAVVLPYRHIYQSGVLLMAMSYGKTVIASDLPAFKEIIIHGNNGFLFENGNAESLASVLKQLPLTRYHETGIAARTFVKEHFGWNQIALLYVRMFGIE
jgi:glycosyltransferase involved in cell wall biosynthesis